MFNKHWTVVLVIFLISSAFGDIYMKQKQHTDPISIMGQTQPAQDVVSETWITENKVAVSTPDQKILIDAAQQTMTMADHQKRTLATIPMDFSKMAEEGGMSDDEKAQFQQFMGGMMNIDMTIQKTSETKKIGKWNCTKYIQTMNMGMGTITSEIWATTDINVDQTMYTKYTAGMMAQLPGVSQNLEKITKELEKIKGIQVYTSQSMDMMGQTIKTTSELLEYKEGNPPSDAFTLPTGYKKTNPFQ